MGMKVITEFVSDLSGEAIEGNASFTLRAVDNSNPDGDRVVFDISTAEWEEFFATLQSSRTEKKIGRKKGSENTATATEEEPSEDAPASSHETPSGDASEEPSEGAPSEENTEEEPSEGEKVAPSRGRKTATKTA